MRAIDKPYIGYLNTPVLWTGTPHGLDIKQFVMPKHAMATCNLTVEGQLRLGKLVERFVAYELNQDDNIEILIENIQIQQNKRTLGELDCILKQADQLVHLEIVYKFYLYDPEVGTTELDHWIGPNRKDCLIDKLTKLKDKQLPLLYNPETKKHLDLLHISLKNMVQQVYFKAQLFVPYGLKSPRFNVLNPDCIQGFYISYKALDLFKTCKFYMPKKIDWLCVIEPQIPWETYTNFKKLIMPLMIRKTAPLCWVKHANGLTEKCFIVWWL
ncbi:DUF1853 family protein [uncultured Formosa sp.]|uniref:DUF1853 family protein n=1 Tax=uncultured Formosa sp. TaxID=255435 RepID=UPI0026196F0F|nr:DUF1853 family protein [uncultured Formosa sp.]